MYDKKQAASWSRKDVYIEDIPTAKKICVKLWDSHADKIHKEQEGQTVLIKNVEVDIYQDRRQLKTTDLTTVTIDEEVSEEHKSFEGEYEVMGIDEDENGCTIVLADDTELVVDCSLLEKQGVSVEEFTFMTPIKVRLTVKNGKLTEIIIPKL